MVGAGGAEAAGGAAGGAAAGVSSVEKTKPRQGSTVAPARKSMRPDEDASPLPDAEVLGRPHSSTSPEVLAAPASQDSLPLAWVACIVSAPPGGRQVRQPASLAFQHLVQTYCRQSMQKLKMPVNSSAEGDAVSGPSRSSSFRWARRSSLASMPRLPEAEDLPDDSVDV